MSTLQAIYLRLKNILVHLLHYLSSTKENRSKYLLIRGSVSGRGKLLRLELEEEWRRAKSERSVCGILVYCTN